MAELHKQVLYMYFLELPEDTKFTLTDGEVEELIWMDFDEFSTLLDNKELRKQFINHKDFYLMYVISEIKNRLAK